jgi:hypothetical protein
MSLRLMFHTKQAETRNHFSFSIYWGNQSISQSNVQIVVRPLQKKTARKQRKHIQSLNGACPMKQFSFNPGKAEAPRRQELIGGYLVATSRTDVGRSYFI